MASADFVKLVDRKLVEVGFGPLTSQPGSFGLDERQRLALRDAVRKDLARVVRLSEPEFDFDGLLARYDTCWVKVSQ
jgi:hypothetical protein